MPINYDVEYLKLQRKITDLRARNEELEKARDFHIDSAVKTVRQAREQIAEIESSKRFYKERAKGYEIRITELHIVVDTALKAICLTRDYVGPDKLPATGGWEWFDAGNALCSLVPDCEWAKQFQLRVDEYVKKHSGNDK